MRPTHTHSLVKQSYKISDITCIYNNFSNLFIMQNKNKNKLKVIKVEKNLFVCSLFI